MIAEIADKEERARQMGILRFAGPRTKLFNYSKSRLLREEDPARLQKRTEVMAEFPEFRLLHNLYYSIEYMYTKLTCDEAEKVWDEWTEMLPPANDKKYQEWCDLYSVDDDCFEAFRSLSTKQFQKFKPYILNYFNPGCQETNGPTKGRNGDVQRRQRLFVQTSAGTLLYASNVQQRIVYTFDVKTIPKSAWNTERYYNMGFMTPKNSWSDVFGGSRYRDNRPQTIEKFELGSVRIPFSIPRFIIGGENDWLEAVFSEELTDEMDNEYYHMRMLYMERRQQRIKYPGLEKVVIDDEAVFLECMWEAAEPDLGARIRAEMLENPVSDE